tara:strand:+ start:125 stop:298 length:174 start_codon:yes stop_codon:yes gene_type:complete
LIPIAWDWSFLITATWMMGDREPDAWMIFFGADRITTFAEAEAEAEVRLQIQSQTQV